MYLINTTFHIHSSIAGPFMRWVTEVYAPTLAASFTDVLFTRILISMDPDALSFAIQSKALSLEEAHAWDENTGSRLRQAFGRGAGEKFLFFTTEMEILDL